MQFDKKNWAKGCGGVVGRGTYCIANLNGKIFLWREGYYEF